MAETIIERLQRELAEVEGLTEAQRDLLTSQAVIERVLPILSVITKAQVEEVQKVKDLTGEKMRILADRVLKSPEQVQDISQFMREVVDGNFEAAWVEELMENLKDHWLWGPIMSIIFAGVHTATMAYTTMAVSSERTKQIANKLIKPYLLDLDTLMKWYFREPGNEGIVHQEMEKLGLSDDKINTFIAMQHELLPIDILATLYLREEISEDELDTELTKHKYKPEDRDHLKYTMATWPGVQDLVRFAVREVFSPALAAELGLYEDLPEDFLIETRKAGLSDDYAKMFWGAHWNPPALNQAFSMFHRGVIDEQGLNNLLRVNDYMPNYREQLIEIAYNPLTRVDIRRIYEDGFIDFDQLVTGYMDLGYNEENSILMGEWVDKRWGQDRRDLTRTDVLRMYDLGAYDRPTAKEALITVGYNEYEAEELLLRNDLITAQKDKKNKIRLWKKQYIKTEKTKELIAGEMRSYGMQTKEIELLFSEWDIDIQEKDEVLSNTEIKQIFQAGFIAATETYARLITKGYNSNDASLLVALWESQIEQPKEE